jgi:hypothetical protein
MSRPCGTSVFSSNARINVASPKTLQLTAELARVRRLPNPEQLALAELRALEQRRAELLAHATDQLSVAAVARPVGAIGCKASRHRWHLRQRRHLRICNLQNLKGRIGFESHPLRHILLTYQHLRFCVPTLSLSQLAQKIQRLSRERMGPYSSFGLA